MDLYAATAGVAPERAERIAFMTGGAFTSRSREFLEQVRNPLVEKPFDVRGLRVLVHTLFRRSPPTAAA